MQKGIEKDVGKIFTTNEVCKAYNITRANLYKWLNKGLKRHERWHGLKRTWLYYQNEVNEFLEEQKGVHRQAMVEAGAKTRKRLRDKYFINYPLPHEVVEDEKKKETFS